MRNKLILMLGIVLLAFAIIVYATAPDQPTLNNPATNSLLNLTYTMLNLTVTDDDGDNMNISFYHQVFVGNITLNRTLTEASDDLQTVYVDDNYIYTSGDGKDIQIYYKTNFTLFKELTEPIATIRQLWADSDYLYAGGGDIIYVYYTQNFSSYINLTDSSSIFVAMSDSNYVYGAGGAEPAASNEVQVYYKNNMTLYTNLTDPTSYIYSGYVDNDYLYISDYNHNLYVYYKNMTLKTTLTEASQSIMGIYADDDYIYTASSTGRELTIYYKNNMSLCHEISDGYPASSWTFGVWADENYIYGAVSNVGVGDTKVVIFHKDNFTSYLNLTEGSNGVNSLTSDNDYLYVPNNDNNLYVYIKPNALINTTTNIANGSYATYNWTGLTNNQLYNWYITITDGTDTTTSSVYSFFVYNHSYTTSYTTPVLETSSQTFTLNITRNSTYIENGNATLHWNGTDYAVDATVYATYLWFSKTLTIPSVNNQTNVTLNWTYTLQSYDGSTSRTPDYTQTIYNIDIDDCSTYSIIALNFSLIEESNNASIAGDMDFTFSLTQEGITINYSKSVTGVNSTAFCIPTDEVSFTAQLQSEYTAAAYDGFTYFAYNLAVTNTTQYIYYYLTNGTTIVTFTVQDQDSNDLQNAYIKVMKYDIGTGLYKTVEVLKTDEQGQALGNIILDTAWYKFMVEYNGIVYLDTTATKMTTTTRTFRINLLSDFFNRYTDVIYNIYSTLNYTEATGNFAFTYSDPNGDYHQGCLKVTKESLGGQTLIGESCTESTAATILVNVNSTGAVNGTYFAVGYILFDDKYVLQTLSRTWGSLSEKFGKEGLFYAFFIILVCVMVAVFSPKLAIILAIIGLIFTNILGFYYVNVSWLIVLIIGAILTIYRMRAD